MTPQVQLEIDIDVADTRWDALDDIDALARQTIITARSHFCPHTFSEISLLFTDNAQIQSLNKSYRHKDKPTNVLSFPTHIADAVPIALPTLGDIVLAYETIAKEANLAQISLTEHTAHLLVHGYLHLQGLDHQEDDQAEVMETTEIKVLADLGISNPYASPDRDEDAKG